MYIRIEFLIHHVYETVKNKRLNKTASGSLCVSCLNKKDSVLKQVKVKVSVGSVFGSCIFLFFFNDQKT